MIEHCEFTKRNTACAALKEGKQLTVGSGGDLPDGLRLSELVNTAAGPLDQVADPRGSCQRLRGSSVLIQCQDDTSLGIVREVGKRQGEVYERMPGRSKGPHDHLGVIGSPT